MSEDLRKFKVTTEITLTVDASDEDEASVEARNEILRMLDCELSEYYEFEEVE